MTIRISPKQYEIFRKMNTPGKPVKMRKYPISGKEPRETEVMNQILKYLKLKGVFCWRNNSMGVFDPVKKIFRKTNQLRGVSDILGITIGGRFLAIEVKTKKGKASPEQVQFLDEIKNRGGVGVLARSLDDVRSII